MMNHSFDAELAMQYGVHEAILIQHFQFWIVKNKANGTHQHDGRTWTYNKVEAFATIFPYLTTHQIRRALDSLVDRGVLVVGNYNESKYLRTKWYAFFDECIFVDSQLHLANPTNGAGTGAKTKADVNANSKPANNPDVGNADGNEEGADSGQASRLPSTWVLPKAWGNWALDQFAKDGWDEAYVRQVADKFKDHYRSLPGDKGERTGWDGVWRNWCRKEYGPRQKAGTAGASGVAGPWYATESGILAKGAELGMKPLSGELARDFKARIDAAIEGGGAQAAQRSRADMPPAPAEGGPKRFKRGEIAKQVAEAVAALPKKNQQDNENPTPESET